MKTKRLFLCSASKYRAKKILIPQFQHSLALRPRWPTLRSFFHTIPSGHLTFNLLIITLIAFFLLAFDCVAKSSTVTYLTHGTIQDSVDQAKPGDTIYVSEGVYRETVTIAKSLKLIGSGTYETIVDGDTDLDGVGNGRVFYIAPNVTVTIANMTIQNGNVSEADESKGGGILNQGHLTVRGCDIHNNNGGYHGGGICNWAGDGVAEANLTIYDSIVQTNEAMGGGGISNVANEGTAISNIWSTDVSNNSVMDPGGGIQNLAHYGVATVNVWYSSVHHNSARDAHGGGFQNWAEYNTAVATLNVQFSNIELNIAETDGGGIWNGATAGAAVLIVRDSSIVSNDVPYGSGGGIFSHAVQENSIASVNVYNSGIYRNTAFGGSGIYNWATDGNAITKVWRCDIYKNFAKAAGSAILNTAYLGHGTANLMVHKTRIHHNITDGDGGIKNWAEQGAAVACVYHSKIRDNTAEDGGGIFNSSDNDGTALMSVTKSNLTKNLAQNGGGIWNAGILTIEKSRILHNEADRELGHGGGIYFIAGNEPILVGTNIVRNNSPENIYKEE